MDYISKLRLVSSTVIIAENLPGFFFDNNTHCVEFFVISTITQRIMSEGNNEFSNHIKISMTHAKFYFSTKV